MFKKIKSLNTGSLVTSLALSLVVTAALSNVGPAYAAPITTINGLSYDLGQFTGAGVTTNVGTGALDGSTFDNPNGFDLFTLGELATAHFGGDFGDRITLGLTDGDQDMLTLTYGTPVSVGAGDLSKFVIFEQSGRDFLDPEGTSFQISFNGGTFVDAGTSGSVTATGGVAGAGGTEQNQIVFDLTHLDIGFVIGDTITTVKIQNLGTGGGTDDPDFLFAARAGIEVPEPGTLALFGLGLAGLGFARRKKAA